MVFWYFYTRAAVVSWVGKQLNQRRLVSSQRTNSRMTCNKNQIEKGVERRNSTHNRRKASTTRKAPKNLKPMNSLAATLLNLLHLFAPVAIEAYSYAHDHSTSCRSWADKGFCHDDDESVALRTKQLCPISCGILPILVDDSDDSCPQWAASGACEDNPLALMKDCPLACGHASNVCVDVHPECASWKHQGHCHSNSAFMELNCAASCVCERRCVDKATDCAGWAAANECLTNPGLMLAKCPVSCGLCESTLEEVVDISDFEKCAVWARNGECERNPDNMNRRCPRSCGIGEILCGDKAGYDSCQNWKKNGECESNADAMAISCAASCGLCTRIERHYHQVASGSSHDEL